MTEAENALRTLGHRILTEAKQELEKTGAITPVCIVHEKDGPTRRFEMPAELMNSGPAKTLLFEGIRQYVQKHKADGCVFVTDTWMTMVNLKSSDISKEEFDRIYREQGAGELVKRGVAERVEALVVTVQSPDVVRTLTQPYGRDDGLRLITFGKLEEREFPQTYFAGRQKMFGDLRPENIT